MQRWPFAVRCSLRRTVEFEVLPEFYIFLSVMLLLLPLPWLFAALGAGFLHELGHYLSVKAFRIPVYRILLGAGGARMKTGAMNPPQSVLCASAGPFVGGLLFLLFPILPRVAVCGLLQTVYNILPFPDFDGSRILRGILTMLVGEKRAKKILPVFSVGIIIICAFTVIRFHLIIGLITASCILFKFRSHISSYLTKSHRVLN